MARLHNPDLIILDLLMPYMEGSEVADQLLQTLETAKIPVVFLTALADKAQVQAGSGTIAGRQFIAKPVTTAELVKRIDGLIQA
jgi:CheY-like chemotaxis protein